MTNTIVMRNLGKVGGSMRAETGSSRRVRLTGRVVSALEELPAEVAASIAEAIESIGDKEGKEFKPPDGSTGERYMVMIPDHDEAPVVVYRSDGDGYLVTGLMKRADYKTYIRPVPSTSLFDALDTPVEAALLVGGALLIAYLLSRSKAGGSGGSMGTAA